MNTKSQAESESGIILLAKKFGKTSFASLSSIKHALGTGKVGHTGTLDSFADGLLVVLSGRLTRLVPHITNFDKKYLALIEFGSETDTLDPTGEIVKSSEKIPARAELESAIQSFIGEIEQVPPLFSALHIDGKRASDLARSGKTAEIPARKINIFDIKLLEYKEKYAIIEVHCSKGTYIRSLARDIAYKCGTFAHLAALRRTSVGPFELKDATFASELDEFTIDSLLKNPRVDSNSEKSDLKIDYQKEHAEIKANLKTMTPALAKYCGMIPVFLSPYFEDSYSNGRPVNHYAFSNFFSTEQHKKVHKVLSVLPEKCELAVFYPKGKFGGVLVKNEKKFSYGFVIPKNSDFSVYTWDEIVNGKFNEEFRKAGTSLTIGSFDGPHVGHDALFDSALAEKSNGLVPGVVTFTKSLRAFKNPAVYPGDIASLSQKLQILRAKGFSFAVVIDFSPDFARIEGTDFLKILADSCGMKFLSEGKDFHCGYKGSTGVEQISEFGLKNDFSLRIIDAVMFGEKKISSSRVRECIVNADFDSVEFMLEQPFTVDCSVFEWKKKVSSENLEFSNVELEAKKVGLQILPPDGSYKVLVVMSLDNSSDNQNRKESGYNQPSLNVRAYRSDCTLKNGILRLSFFSKLISGCVRAVIFDCPD